jgi:hypothetical protein
MFLSIYHWYVGSIITIIYLFKKFLVSDWLTANCEIVISTQWLTKYGFFTFILAKWRQRVNMKKIWTRCAILLWRRESYRLADAIDMTTTAVEGLRNCFFLNTNKIQMASSTATCNAILLLRDVKLPNTSLHYTPLMFSRLALVSICEIDVTSFSEDGRGVKWLCN